MSDINGAAAPAESVAAPAPEVVADLPNPITTSEPEAKEVKAEPKAEKVEDKKPLTAREALTKAAAKVEKDNAPVKTEAKVEIKTDKPRDETGKFAPKDGEKPAEVKTAVKPAVETQAKAPVSQTDAPSRYSADAKAAWATTPDPVKAETHRALKELEGGIEKHRVAAEKATQAYEGYRELDEIAQQSGKRGADVFRNYYQTEQQLRKDPIGGLETICSRLGLSLRDVAAHVMGQTPDQQASQSDSVIRELKSKIEQLESQVGNVTQTFQHQRESATLQEVTKFAQDNPRFEELSEDIAFFMKSGRAKDLSEAYTLAERLNPAPAKTSEQPAASFAPVIDLSAQTEKGQKSIAGSPNAGSDPVRRQPSSSIKESLKRAMAQAG